VTSVFLLFLIVSDFSVFFVEGYIKKVILLLK
jgi:hypothetical protein